MVMRKDILFKNKFFSIENVLYASFIILSIILRFVSLGKNPLGNSESALALSALHSSDLYFSSLSAQPLYISVTSILFSFFGASNFAARFIPALLGSLICLVPILYKQCLGKRESLIIAFLLVIDPAMIAASKQADSRIMSFFLFIGVIGFLLQGRFDLSGILAGLLLLSGPFFWQISIIVVPILLFYLFYRKWFHDKSYGKKKHKTRNLDRGKIIIFLVYFSIAILLMGTRFFTQFSYLNLIVKSASEYFNNYFSKSSLFITAGFLSIAFLINYFFYSSLGIIGLIFKGIKKYTFVELIIISWFIIAILISFANTNAQAIDLLLITIPIYFFLARTLIAWFEQIKLHLRQSTLIGIPVICFLGFLWLGIIKILNYAPGSVDVITVLIALVGSLFLLGLVLILIAWGWSLHLAINGLLIGFFVLFGLFQLSITWHSTGITPQPEQEIWWLDDYFNDAEEVDKIVRDISEWNTGFQQGLEVQILNRQNYSMQWLLRDQKLIHIGEYLSTSKPQIIVSQDENQPDLIDAYRGQQFVMRSYPYWKANLNQSIFSIDFFRWLFLRGGYVIKERNVLWARSDLFIGADIKFEKTN